MFPNEVTNSLKCLWFEAEHHSIFPFACRPLLRVSSFRFVPIWGLAQEWPPKAKVSRKLHPWCFKQVKPGEEACHCCLATSVHALPLTTFKLILKGKKVETCNNLLYLFSCINACPAFSSVTEHPQAVYNIIK